MSTLFRPDLHRGLRFPRTAGEAFRDAADAWQVLQCANCGKPVKKLLSRLVSERAYCNKACFGNSCRKPPATPATFADYMANFDELLQHASLLPNGYRMIRLYREGKSFRIYEHRLVLQRKLGRELLPHEVAHHIDGCRTNNDPANLTAMSERDHAREHLNERIAKGDAMKNHYRAPTVTLNCAACGIAFTKPKYLLANNVKKGQRPCCSRSCAATYSKVQA